MYPCLKINSMLKITQDHDQEQNENLDGSSGNKGGGSILTWKPQDIEKVRFLSILFKFTVVRTKQKVPS